MASYEIVFRPSIEKDFRHLSKSFVRRVIARVERLKVEPFPREAVKLSGGERLWRIRVGDHRIIYEVDVQSKRIIIHYIRHRREVYRRP